MADSTVPAAKAALKTAFEASNDLNDVVIEWGDPTESTGGRDLIAIGDSDQFSWEWAGLGAQHIRERSYRIAIRVESSIASDNKQVCEERWWTIVAAMVAAIRADLTLGGTVVAARPQPRVQRLGALSESELLCSGFVDVLCELTTI